MPISQDQLVGLTKQVFILEYLINGLFPCQSDVVRLIRSKKREWKFNDRFEYRMLLAVTNSGGSLNSQVFQSNVELNHAGELDYGTFRATYGSVMDGFSIDMMQNLETKEKQAAFENDYATRMHSLRTNVAGLFKNFAIHGQYGVLHQLRSDADGGVAPSLSAAYGPRANTGHTPTRGQPFTIKVPTNVFQSNFKRGRLLIKTKRETGVAHGPWGNADSTELYMILDNQPGWLALVSIGTTVSPWQNGEFLEVQGNREVSGNNALFRDRSNWSSQPIAVAGSAFAGQNIPLFEGGSASEPYTAYTQQNFDGSMVPTMTGRAVVGAMEGLADLFPWYTDPTVENTRLGTNLPFRGQPNRLMYTTEQAGGWVMQQDGENIIDAIMRGSFLTKSTVPYADIGIWMNPITRTQMGYEEGDQVRVLRDNFVQGPIVWQRGTKTTDYQIGNQVVKEVVEDLNMPTDVIVIGPKDDMAYNAWDNATFQIDDYIQEVWAKTPPKKVEDISIPDELLTRMDLGQRIIYGTPAMNDGNINGSFDGFGNMGGQWVGDGALWGSNIRHPRNTMPVALQEMGALFTEYPYTYTIVKLRKPIFDLATT